MKHSLAVTLILVGIFLVSQLVGLAITNQYIDHFTTEETGVVTFTSLPYNITRPEVEPSTSFVYIIAAIILGTALVFLIIRFKALSLWRFWFFLSVFITLTVAFAAFINQLAAGLLALIFAIWKVYRPNVYVHNLTEIFVYGGLAAIFVPIINLFAAGILLALISCYDAYAVWKSKHMIALAKAQSKAKLFAGLFIPYSIPKAIPKGAKVKVMKIKTAILGGGDVGFPLIFAGVVMKGLMLTNTVGIGFLKSLVIPAVTSVALLWLLVKADKDKFYPAMPFLTAGCFIGYGIIWLLGWV